MRGNASNFIDRRSAKKGRAHGDETSIGEQLFKNLTFGKIFELVAMIKIASHPAIGKEDKATIVPQAWARGKYIAINVTRSDVPRSDKKVVLAGSTKHSSTMARRELEANSRQCKEQNGEEKLHENPNFIDM